MRSTLVYDLPTRIFHWIFSSLFLLSFVIAKTIDDDSTVFMYHMLSGLLLGGLVLWRLIWGVVGSKHARFSGFDLNPFHLKDYFLGIISGSKKRWSGHNPASSWAALTMFALAFGLSVTGYLMTTGQKENFEDIHELMANSFIIVVILHVLGVILHSIRHRDAIALSMIDGKKQLTENGEAIVSSNKFAAVILIALIVSTGLYLVKNFDAQSGSLQLFGQTLQLGEGQEGSSEGASQVTPENEFQEETETEND